VAVESIGGGTCLPCLCMAHLRIVGSLLAAWQSATCHDHKLHSVGVSLWIRILSAIMPKILQR